MNNIALFDSFDSANYLKLLEDKIDLVNFSTTEFSKY